MTQEEKTKIEERIVDVLKTVYDPEIPVNIYDLGMIYKIDVRDDGAVADGQHHNGDRLPVCAHAAVLSRSGEYKLSEAAVFDYHLFEFCIKTYLTAQAFDLFADLHYHLA